MGAILFTLRAKELRISFEASFAPFAPFASFAFIKKSM